MSDSTWAISTGAYSDYQVMWVFATEEAARAVCDELTNGRDGPQYDDGYRVEEFPFYAEAPTIHWGWKASWFDFRERPPFGGWDPMEVRSHKTWEFNEPYPSRPKVETGGRSIEAVCVDREAAVKAVADRVAMKLAHTLPDEEKRGS